MKKLLLFAVLFVAACDSSTKYGACVGIQDLDQRDHSLEWKTPGWNIAMAIIFSETLIGPGIFFFSDFSCPVGQRTLAPGK